MFDRSLVTSNFDTETLLSEDYLTYLLLAQIEAGLLELEFDVVGANPPTDLTVTIHPPDDDRYQRLYPPATTLPTSAAFSLGCSLLPGDDSPILDAALTPDGTRLLTRSDDRMVRVWDLATNRTIDALEFEAEPAISSAFDTATAQLATTTVDRKIRVWDVAAKSVTHTLTGHTLAACCVAFSTDGQRLVSGSFDETVRIWDVQTGALLQTLTGHDGQVTCVAFNPAGTRIVSGGVDGTVRVWDAQTGAPVHVLSDHTNAVTCVAFSNTGNSIVSGSADTTLKLWNAGAGTLSKTYSGHTNTVTWVDVGPTHIISGSRDGTVKLWSSTGSNPIRTITDHRSEITRVCFAGNGPRNVSVSTGGSILVWDGTVAADPVLIRRDFMHVTAFVTVVDHLAGNAQFQGLIGMIVFMAILSDRSANGLESNHVLQLSLARLDDPTKGVLQGNGVDVDVVEARIREHLNRELPLGVAQGQQVQQIRMRKFVDGTVGTLGIYVDLALKNGPANDYVAPRGNTALAQSFRPDDMAIAFATSPGLFALLGPDAKFRRAELAPGSSEYRYPFREDMNDSSSKELGEIESFSVGPTIVVGPNGTVVNLNTLRIAMDGDYTDTTPDIGFTAEFYFTPKLNAERIVEWDSRVDIDLGILGTLLFILGGLLILMPYMAPVGITFWLVVGTMATLVGRQVAEHLASKELAETVDEESQASVLDSMPFRLPAATRRWDPFYETQHQVVARLDEPFIIDSIGMAFQAKDLVLDKQPVLVADVAPYDEVRDMGNIVAIRYEVPDAAAHADDFKATGPGLDQMAFAIDDPINEPTLVTLALDEIEARKNAERILAPIVLDARRINLFEGQIDRMLCTTWLVRERARDRLIDQFQRAARVDIEANELPAIEQAATTYLTAKLGRAPTGDELAKEVELRVQGQIAERQKAYEDGDLRDDMHVALAPLLHFDVGPDELAALQKREFFSLDGKEIIVRKGTPYYRDHPDGDPRDNLLSLPHYSHPYVPPGP